jgi:hypothetical protein
MQRLVGPEHGALHILGAAPPEAGAGTMAIVFGRDGFEQLTGRQGARDIAA